MQRRDFLIVSLGSLGATCGGVTVSADDASPLEIIDTHTHFYDPSRPQGVPWPGKNDQRLYRTVLPDEFMKLARPLGVVGTVVVEASSWLEDNQWLLDLADKSSAIVGIVGHLNPQADDFEKHIRRFSRHPLYHGIRISQGTLVDGLKAGGQFLAACKLLDEHDLELDVNGGPEMPAHVARLAAQFNDLRIVINHCANLTIDGREPPRAWREAMTAAAKHPRVFCKVSALVEHTMQKPAPRDVGYYRPVLDVLWELFGPDRLIFGSNWPVSDNGAPLETVVGIVRDYFTAHGPRAAAKYFRDNAQAAYGCRKR